MQDRKGERMTEQQRQQPAELPVRGNGQGSPAVAATAKRRPGLLTFAAVMMFIVAGFSVLLAITESLADVAESIRYQRRPVR
jgi:hypothetical protein